MPPTCSSAEITAPRSLAACVPYSATVVLSSTQFRRVCRAVSLSTDGLLVLSTHPLAKGQALRVSLPLPGARKLEIAAVITHESTYLGRRALDIRFVGLTQRDRLLIGGLVAQPSKLEAPRRVRVATPVRARRRSATPASASHNEFDGLPSTDELDSLLAKTLADLEEPVSTAKKRRKGRFRW